MRSTRRDFLKASLRASAVLSIGTAAPRFLVEAAAAEGESSADTILVEWNPDHAASRELLGYRRKGKQWAEDPDAKVQRQNMKNEKESQASFDKRVAKWREQRAKADRFLAAKYAEVALACQAKGYAEQTRKAAERAVALDGDCEPARKLLGYERMGKLWVTQAKAEAMRAGEWFAGMPRTAA